MTPKATPTGHSDATPEIGGGDGYISLERAGEIAERHPESIKRWIRDGELEARRSASRGRPYEVLERSLRAKLDQLPVAPTGGGIFDPEWGPFVRDPFPSG